MGIDLESIKLDDSGRVVLSDEVMGGIEQTVALASAGGNNRPCPGGSNMGGCVNELNCEGSTNSGCSNQGCGGTTNYSGCLNTEIQIDS